MIQKISSVLEDSHPDENSLHSELSDLLTSYKKLYKQTTRLIKFSDRASADLIESQRQLEVRNQFIRNTFGRYLSEEIVDNILDSPEGLDLGGEKRHVTIMMNDLRGFTSLGEMLPPEGVVKMLNIYLDTMTDIILKYNGTIDEFIGDAILTIFGAPVLREDDAKRAVACAIEMQLAMDSVNKKVLEAGLPEIEMGIGINTGDVVVGNIGSEKRVKYGVVGKNVNLTSRIESYTIGGQILISESTLNDCGPILRIDNLIEITPKGFEKPIPIYEIGGINGDFNISLPERKNVESYKPDKPISIKFTVMEGKFANIAIFDGKITSLSMHNATICTKQAVDKLSNIKISIFDKSGNKISKDVSAKITDITKSEHIELLASFTFVPPETREFFKTILPSEHSK